MHEAVTFCLRKVVVPKGLDQVLIQTLRAQEVAQVLAEGAELITRSLLFVFDSRKID